MSFIFLTLVPLTYRDAECMILFIEKENKQTKNSMHFLKVGVTSEYGSLRTHPLGWCTLLNMLINSVRADANIWILPSYMLKSWGFQW